MNYTNTCVLIDEARFNTNMKNNWARSASGAPAIVMIPKTRTIKHTIIGAMHSSCGIKKAPTKS